MLSSWRVGLGPRVVSCPLSSNSAVREEQGECPVQERRELLSLCHVDAAWEMQFWNRCFAMLTCSCRIMQQQLIKFLSAGWRCSGVGVQQQLQLKEESKHTTYYWKYSGLTVQHIGHILWIILLTYWAAWIGLALLSNPKTALRLCFASQSERFPNHAGYHKVI